MPFVLAYFCETLGATSMTRRSSSTATFAGARFRTTDADRFAERGNRDALLGIARFRPNHQAKSPCAKSRSADLGEKFTSPREPLNSSCEKPQKSYPTQLPHNKLEPIEQTFDSNPRYLWDRSTTRLPQQSQLLAMIAP
jgi:hypothetical protein